jgi:hypothetical protein
VEENKAAMPAERVFAPDTLSYVAAEALKLKDTELETLRTKTDE